MGVEANTLGILIADEAVGPKEVKYAFFVTNDKPLYYVGLIVFFTPVIYVISSFCPYKIFGFDLHPRKKKIIRKTPLHCPTHQICLS